MTANTARISVLTKSRVAYVPAPAGIHDRDLFHGRRSRPVERVLL